jgi:hypothetical protein
MVRDGDVGPPFHEMNELSKRLEQMSAQLLGREPALEASNSTG